MRIENRASLAETVTLWETLDFSRRPLIASWAIDLPPIVIDAEEMRHENNKHRKSWLRIDRVVERE